MKLPNSNILIVDDEENIRKLFIINLERLGYNSIAVSNSEEAIMAYQQSQESKLTIDAIILDLTLPGDIGGKEIAKKIRDINPQVKIIVSSGYSESSEMMHYKAHGFDAAIEKNFNREILKQVLTRVLEIT